jgi:hypothetical protein
VGVIAEKQAELASVMEKSEAALEAAIVEKDAELASPIQAQRPSQQQQPQVSPHSSSSPQMARSHTPAELRWAPFRVSDLGPLNPNTDS